MRIFLIGYMGSGKSTIGQLITSRINCEFLDTDQEIERQEEKSISEIFSHHGEDYFREKETELIVRISEMADVVVSTGGGFPCHGDNMKRLNELGTTIYLKADPNTLSDRIKKIDQRPVLENRKGKDLQDFIHEHLKEREIYYKECQIEIDANQGIENIVNQIINQFNSPWIK